MPPFTIVILQPKRTLSYHIACRGYSTQWDNYFIQLEPVASRVPFMLGVGNHERNWPGSGDRWGSMGVFDSGGECGVPYERRARMPLPGV